jgi:hypothetical protein
MRLPAIYECLVLHKQGGIGAERICHKDCSGADARASMDLSFRMGAYLVLRIGENYLRDLSPGLVTIRAVSIIIIIGSL